MTDEDLESARDKWLIDEPLFAAFSEVIKPKIETAISNLGIHAEVAARTKDVDSLIKKLIMKMQEKKDYSYESLGDKLGVRVVVRYKSETKIISQCLRRIINCSKPDDKKDNLKDYKVGYLAIHFDVSLKDNDPDIQKFPPCKFKAELQIKTLAEHLWSEMSHDVTYKGFEGVIPLSHRREVKLLAGLLEIADNEFSRLNSAMAKFPHMAELKILKALERQYFKLTTKGTRKDLSIDVIKALAPIYRTQPNWNDHFQKLFKNKEDMFRRVFREYSVNSHGRSAFLFQPEVFLIYDLLDKKPYELRAKWNDVLQFPELELERLAIVFGRSVSC